MVAVAFILANLTMTMEMKRKERQGILKPIKKRLTAKEARRQQQSDLYGAVIIGFILGFKIPDIVGPGDLGMSIQDYLLSFEGSWLGGILVALAMGGYRYYRQQKEGLPTEDQDLLIHPYQLMGTFTVAAAISGLLGAKIFHNLENWKTFMEDPMGNLVSFSGLTFYGGLIFGAATVLYLAAKNGINWRHMLDIGAPAMMLAYGVGRIGCHISGDGDWGIVNTSPKPSWLNWAPDWVWAYRYPNNVLNEGVSIPGCEGEYCSQLALPVFPTPLYEAIACVILFFVLWKLRTRVKIPGMLFGIYLVLNGLERFFIEKIRVNNKTNVLGMEMTQAEVISFSLILLGVVGIVYFWRDSKKRAQNLAH